MTREEAIRRIKAWNLDSDDMEVLAVIIPELAESEDERMMREFNDWLCEEIECRTNDLRDEKDRRTLNMLCYILTKVKDWLEKQKEQKQSLSEKFRPDFPLKSLCPHWKPSEEQMKALEDAFRKNGSDEYRKTINSLYQDLKKL